MHFVLLSPALLLSAALAFHPPHPAQDGEQLPNGWHAYFSSKPETGIVPNEVDTHREAAAFALDRGESIHPLINMADFRARFASQVTISMEGAYRFGARLEGGRVTVSVLDRSGNEVARCTSDQDGEAWTEWVKLPRGNVNVAVSYARDGYQKTRLQARWEMRFEEGRSGFPDEPIPSHFARVPQDAQADVLAGLAAVESRVLLQRKGCVNCHASTQRSAVDLLAAPHLTGIGDRVSASWMARWIRSPHEVRPHSDMPRLFAPEESESAMAIAAFLASGAEDHLDDAQREGRELFHTIGCFACHGAYATTEVLSANGVPSTAVPDAPVAPFGDVNGKWKQAALVEFLLDPAAHRPAGRMPDMQLRDDEAEDLASYLQHIWAQGRGPLQADVVAKGRREYEERSCAACHILEGMDPPEQTAPTLAQLDLSTPKGCLDPEDVDSPRYALADGEAQQLADAIRAVLKAEPWPSPLDAAERTVANMACTACHAWNGVGGPDTDVRAYFVSNDDLTDLGDEGRLAPNLSGVGFKLTTPWMKQVLLEGGVARPYVATRMPQFGSAHMEDLADWLAKREGVWPNEDDTEPEATETRVLTGRKMMGQQAMTCVSCHDFKDYPPAGSPGPDLTAFAERLRYAWWRSYVHDPARYKPGTRMPSFSMGNKSAFPSFADGTMTEQADCMWSYFSLGEFMPAPEGVEPSQALQITVGERPRVMRTFLENAGPRGIAVGHPVGLHFGFDAAGVRLAEAWQGEFLDAAGAWAGRGGQVVGGRGAVSWLAPPGPPLLFGGEPEAWPEAAGKDAGYAFRGYRLRPDGNPVFMYEVEGVEMREDFSSRLSPLTMLRRFTIVKGWSADRPLWLQAGTETSNVVNLRGVEPQRVSRDDGSTWYRLIPTTQVEPRSFTLEVTLQ